MKRLVCLICSCWLFVSAMAQTSLCISTDKTTSLVFPFSILHVDRGTKDILVQPVQEADNILLVKAGLKEFPETNLSVFTSDGGVYTFQVCYQPILTTWIYYLPTNKKATMATYANGILDNRRTLWGVRDNSWNIDAAVIGSYIKDDVVYYQLRIINNSPIDYDIEVLRFFIRDKKKSKRTAVQENELKPLQISGNTKQAKAFSHTVAVVALEKFTIPDKKFMGIQIMEKNGGRHLSMKLNNKDILRAIPLPDLK
ncbi:MAG: conjugative transposon protein TraN [Sphingobacteriales bacterium]|nr:conjugative transposon protein TraN [Sphingobacteriales bacterium]MBI3717491.1 conjugative transposon protein TraN [Sphingobacteriales bacterium]